MKIKKLYILSALMLTFAVVFTACEDKDDYDYDAIVPRVLQITGPAELAAHGLTEFPIRYEVPYRGGSTWEWTASSSEGNATIVLDDEYSSIAYITFPQSSVIDDGVITVVETTYAGVSSEPFSRTVQLNPFCPYPMEEWVGDYTGTSGSHDPVVTMELGANLNELRVHGLAGFVSFSWGEEWTAGDGSALMEFSCGEIVTIPYQYIGDSDFPDVYYIEGEGTFDPVNKTIEIEYEVFYTGGSASGIVTVLTLGGKSGNVPADFTIKK